MHGGGAKIRPAMSCVARTIEKKCRGDNAKCIFKTFFSIILFVLSISAVSFLDVLYFVILSILIFFAVCLVCHVYVICKCVFFFSKDSQNPSKTPVPSFNKIVCIIYLFVYLSPIVPNFYFILFPTCNSIFFG